MTFDPPFEALCHLGRRTRMQPVAAVLILIGCRLRKREGFVLSDKQRFLFGLRRSRVHQAAEFVSAAAMVRQVAPVVTAKRTELALIWLLTRVRAHVCLQLSLVRRGERTEQTSMGLLSFTHTKKKINHKEKERKKRERAVQCSKCRPVCVRMCSISLACPLLA